LDDKYTLSKVVAAGGQGVVSIFIDNDTKKNVAIKFDPVDKTSLIGEIMFLKDYSANLTMVPKYITHDSIGGRRLVIMDYLP